MFHFSNLTFYFFSSQLSGSVFHQSPSQTLIGCSSKVIDWLSCVGFHSLLRACAESVLIHVTAVGVLPGLHATQGLALFFKCFYVFPNERRWSGHLWSKPGKWTNNFSYRSRYALEQGNNFPAAQQIWLPTVKKLLPGVYSCKGWSLSGMQGTAK